METALTALIWVVIGAVVLVALIWTAGVVGVIHFQRKANKAFEKGRWGR